MLLLGSVVEGCAVAMECGGSIDDRAYRDWKRKFNWCSILVT